MFEFWLIDESNGINMILPVSPGSYAVDYGNKMEVINATEIGDINIAGHKNPLAMELEGFFTVRDYPFVQKNLWTAANPFDYVEIIKRWVDEKTVIRHTIIDGWTTKLNALFRVEYINYSEDGESNGDINYRISLKEYRKLNTPTVGSGNQGSARVHKYIEPTYYTTIEGDYLTKIARKFFGDPLEWERIYINNMYQIGDDPNVIYPGTVLYIV